jgi:hypothetical protein
MYILTGFGRSGRLLRCMPSPPQELLRIGVSVATPRASEDGDLAVLFEGLKRFYR